MPVYREWIPIEGVFQSLPFNARNSVEVRNGQSALLARLDGDSVKEVGVRVGITTLENCAPYTHFIQTWIER